MLAKDLLLKNRLILIFILLFTACAPQVAATPIASSAPAATQIKAEPITLHLAVSDAQGRPSEPYVHAFIEQVKSLSDGNITIEPTWDAGAEITPFFEQGVVKIVKEGQYELGLAGSRAWDGMDVTSFQALQAPFLITDDALSEAVASSEIGIQMLDALSSAGMTGLALWPEDLRHPFSMNPDKPILSPDDLKGLTVRSIPSEVSYLLITTLGGSPMYGDDYQAAESGLRQGASLSGTPTATGNVIFFPKFLVLFANGAALEKLSEGQRSILREAAVATQKKAIAEHPTEVDAAAAWCADGGTVVMASTEQIAAFEAAAKPVFDKIEQDPLNAELIAAIRELKAKTTPAPGAQACESEISQSNPAATAENMVWSTGVPPNGKWTVNLTMNDVIAKGVRASEADGWSGLFFFEFQDGKGLFRAEYLSGFIAACPFTYEAVEDFFRNTYIDLGQPNYECGPQIDDLQWRLDEEGQLHLHVIDIKAVPFLETKANFEAKPWQKVTAQPFADDAEQSWSTGQPPNGVWQVELTTNDIVQKGVRESEAVTWAGTYTWTFKDDKARIEYTGTAGTDFICEADLVVEEDVLKVIYSSGSACDGGVDDIRWRLDVDRLHLQLLAITNAPLLENKAYYEAKPWQKVEEN